jgi:DNA-binding CsgD family transcriptional regulator
MSQGQVFDYDAEARARLRALVAAVERDEAQPTMHEGRAPLALWWDMVEGRSRLVEHFESGGRRYYVAYDNGAGTSPLMALNPRERWLVVLVGSGQSEKVVGYALGVRPSLVSGLLKATLLKLGLRSRAELVVFMGSVGFKPGDESSRWATSSSQAGERARRVPADREAARRSAAPRSKPPLRDGRTRGLPSDAPSLAQAASGLRAPRPG